MSETATLVCAWCDVYARVPCEMRDESGRVFQTWTKCAHCGRTELGFKKGYRAPIPKKDRIDVSFPF